MGGPIAQLSAPARAPRTQNKFEILQEDKKEEEPKPESKGPPKFVGSMKGLFNRQNQENAEANKNLSEFQKKIAEQVKIHDAKPAPRKEGELGERPEHRQFEAGKDGYNRKKESDPKPLQGNDDPNEDDDDFEQVEEERRRGGERRGGRGRGRGGFYRGDDDHEQRRGADRPKPPVHDEEKPKE